MTNSEHRQPVNGDRESHTLRVTDTERQPRGIARRAPGAGPTPDPRGRGPWGRGVLPTPLCTDSNPILITSAGYGRILVKHLPSGGFLIEAPRFSFCDLLPPILIKFLSRAVCALRYGRQRVM